MNIAPAGQLSVCASRAARSYAWGSGIGQFGGPLRVLLHFGPEPSRHGVRHGETSSGNFTLGADHVLQALGCAPLRNLALRVEAGVPEPAVSACRHHQQAKSPIDLIPPGMRFAAFNTLQAAKLVPIPSQQEPKASSVRVWEPCVSVSEVP